MARFKKHSAWDNEAHELSDLKSFSDESSLVETPKKHRNLNLKKKNRIGSPPLSYESTNESSASLSPATKNAFLAKTGIREISQSSNNSDTQSKLSTERDIKVPSSLSGVETRSRNSDYREQIRSRFLTIKKKAEKLKKKPKKAPNESIYSRELEEEDKIINDELDNHDRLQEERFKQKIRDKITADDFFCKVDFDEEIHPMTAIDETGDIETGDLKKQTVVDLLSLVDADDIVHFQQPYLIDTNSLNEVFNKKIMKDDKPKKTDAETRVMRNMEDEGYFVGTRPKTAVKAINQLQNRLSSLSENSKWFDCNNQLKLLPDPRREDNILMKPILNNYQPVNTNFILSQNNTYDNEVQNAILKLHILKLKYFHHPLFSPEHFLAFRLKRLCKEYGHRQVTGSDIKLQNKLTILRQAKEKIETSLKDGKSQLTNKQKERLKQYTKDIKITRNKHLEAVQVNRETLKSILKTWKSLKQLREKQKYTNTSICLTIKKEPCSYREEQEEWDRAIELETNEIYEEKQAEYGKALEIFRLQLKQWKRNASDETEKPIKPCKDYTIHSIRDYVTQKFSKCFKPPGEPKISFELSDKEITKDITYPREKARRSAVQKTKLQIKIFFDEKEAHKVDSLQLNDTFLNKINQLLSFECRTIPKEVKIQIGEQYRGSKNKWSYKLITLKTPHVQFESAHKQSFAFDLNERIIYSHTGIGMGHDFQNIFDSFSLENIEDCNDIYLSGCLTLYIGWGDINTQIPQQNQTMNQNTEIDPQNPENAELLNYLQATGNETVEIKSYFRLNADADIFCTDEFIEDNPRFRMLRLRAEGVPEFQNVVVPNAPLNDIHPPDLFTVYESRRAQEAMLEGYCIDTDMSNCQIDVQRQWGLRQIKQIRKRIEELCHSADHTHTIKDLLIDDEVPDISLLGLTFMKWFQPKRPLRPARKSVQLSSALTTTGTTEIKVIINIVQAFHVPIRRTGAQDIAISPSLKPNTNDVFSLIPVKPFVTITLGKNTVSTTTAEGANPTWNQELIITIQRRGNEQIMDYIYINLYDEQLIDILEDDRLRQSDIHQRRQIHWLAELQVPISIVTQNNRIEGTFEMNSPSLLIGYERLSFSNNDSVDLTPRTPSQSKNSTYLSLFITTIPTINGNHILKDDKLQCHEINTIEQRIRSWQSDINEMFPERNFPVLVKDINCKTCCITRFLKPLNIPEFEESDVKYLEPMCARLVSLIPFINDGKHFSGVWLTSDYLLKLQIGSTADHAILLQCYFMHLKIKSWLAFGYCLYDGTTAFILLQEPGDSKKMTYSVYNVMNGLKYDVRDTFNPFKRIYCLINNDNIWANVQKEDKLHLLRYDTSKSVDWLPLFNKEFSAPTVSFQPTILEYSIRSNITLLTERIDTKLKTKIMKWRRHIHTIWNRHAAAVFKKLLPVLEEHRIKGENNIFDISDYQNLMLDLQTIMNTHKMYGFPLNMPYTNIKTIVNAVRRTNIQNNDAPNMEFALSVYLREYVGGVLSIWIFIATLVRRR